MQENSQIKSKTSPDQFERVSISIIGILLPKKTLGKIKFKEVFKYSIFIDFKFKIIRIDFYKNKQRKE